MVGGEPANSTVGIKVHHHPRRGGDNVVHPVGQSPPPLSKGSTPLPVVASHNQQQNVSSAGEFRPFRRWLPWLVPLFVGANVVLFVTTMYVNNCPSNSMKPESCIAKFLGRFSFQPMKENPLLGPSSSTLEKMGALDVDKVVDGHQAWRLLSCMWLHAGVFHILANMLSLVFIGIRLEQEFGFIRIGLVYVISGFGGSLLSALFIQSNISVGASGALFGLLGGMLSELITNWTIYANKLAALLTLVLIIIINLAVGILPHVDNFAHIGGFFSGFLLGFVFLIRPQFGWVNQKACPPGYIAPPAKSKHKTYQYVLWVVSVILLIVGFAVGLVTLLRGTNLNDHCSWCHYMSCVPTSLWSCKSSRVDCNLSQFGNELNITCISTGKSHVLSLSADGALSQSQQELCVQLCS
ncbi:KOM, putative [Ricinus communis]|uniref:RHOMBOID-like protein n=1 Tax=Ricinus communis TaxID=3988 RepID=B9T4C7_RICCO|nr:KOM, putative [Ricinus communis]|eukprot:XP_002533096.1 RHOMBOID-like protein 1 [Ricinus communis]